MVRNKMGLDSRWNQGVDELFRLPDGPAPPTMGVESMRSYSVPFGAAFFGGAAFSLALLGFLAESSLSAVSPFPASFSSLKKTRGKARRLTKTTRLRSPTKPAKRQRPRRRLLRKARSNFAWILLPLWAAPARQVSGTIHPHPGSIGSRVPSCS